MDESSGYPTGYLLTKIAQATTAQFTERLASLGIRPKHYGLLFALSSTPPGSQTELGRTLGLVPSAIVTMIDDLERRGAVSRAADPTSRRRFVVELTPAGRDLLARASKLGAAVDDEMLAALSPEGRAALQKLLEEVVFGRESIAARR